MNNVFANHSKEEEIYPLTVKEIAKAQKLDRLFKATALKEKYEKTLIENTSVFCKNGKLVIPQSLQHRAVSWYYHYVQHSGNTRLKKSLKAAMYWKQMHSTSERPNFDLAKLISIRVRYVHADQINFIS